MTFEFILISICLTSVAFFTIGLILVLWERDKKFYLLNLSFLTSFIVAVILALLVFGGLVESKLLGLLFIYSLSMSLIEVLVIWACLYLPLFLLRKDLQLKSRTHFFSFLNLWGLGFISALVNLLISKPCQSFIIAGLPLLLIVLFFNYLQIIQLKTYFEKKGSN
ncbi:hypothetical protein AAEX28_09960 [Lentisphaerota bacterium WC36G]|nr:hypothetical protein LJT99_12795 [Lentisphaerae bacterium WC36]